MQIVFILILLAYIIAAAYTIVKISTAIIFTTKQKRLNIIVTILLPFIWPVLMYYMMKKEPSSYEIEVKNDHSSNNFHESGKGIGGMF